MIRAWVLIACASACGSSSSSCASNEVSVEYLGGGTRSGEIDCEPIPASCGTTPSCSVQACIHDLYGLCDSPYIGVGCSDTFPPVIVSCNP